MVCGLLIAAAPLVGEHRLSSCGPWAPLLCSLGCLPGAGTTAVWAKQGQFTVPAHCPGLASGELLENRMMCTHLPWALSARGGHPLQSRDCPKPGSGTPARTLSLSVLDCDPRNRAEHSSLTITIVYNLPLISHFPSLSYKMPIYSGMHPSI